MRSDNLSSEIYWDRRRAVVDLVDDIPFFAPAAPDLVDGLIGQYQSLRARIDRIVMNPPFSEGRWRAHVEHAYSLLSPGGRLVAVLPASAVGKAIIAGESNWSPVIDNAFAGTSASVAVLSVVKACA